MCLLSLLLLAVKAGGQQSRAENAQLREAREQAKQENARLLARDQEMQMEVEVAKEACLRAQEEESALLHVLEESMRDFQELSCDPNGPLS